MQRKQFLLSSLLAVPAMALAKSNLISAPSVSNTEPFIVKAGQSRFG